jgi:hypothetical protein
MTKLKAITVLMTFLSLLMTLTSCGPDKCPPKAKPKICVLLNEKGKETCECTLHGKVCVADMKYCLD